MLKRRHLSSTKIRETDFCGLLRKKKLEDIVLKMPSTKEELFDRIVLCSNLAEFSYLNIPSVLEACKGKDVVDESTLFFISTLRRNVYQGHKLKDSYLFEALSKGYATVEAHFLVEKKIYSVIDFDGSKFIVRVKKYFIEKYRVPMLDAKPQLECCKNNGIFENAEDYHSFTKKVRTWYVLWHDAMVKFNKKISIHNEVYLELLPMVRTGQIKLVQDY